MAQVDFSIINTAMTVRSMRDSGYKSTTHALAELIDNSIEASAVSIELFGLSRWDEVKSRHALEELAVLDDGVGMDADTLRGALRYGFGTRTKRRGIGRFGLGLPNSSMSQAKRVDVWSWQTGVTNALHTYLAIEDVENGVEEIPKPTHQPLPGVYLHHSLHEFGDSGTLVVWRDLDRVEWRRAATTFKHAEALLGRVYRRFLAQESDRLHPDDSRSGEIGPRRHITCIPVIQDGDGTRVEAEGVVHVRPNDPLYLMPGTTCPEDFGQGPMFKELEGSPFYVTAQVGETVYKIRIRASYARPYARDPMMEGATWPERMRGWDSGSTPWGRHASQNRGVSLMRAHREIELDESWTSGNDARDRWWKVEVDFPTELDELFGVTNNKQGTMSFQRLASFDLRRYALLGESVGDVRRRMEEDGDPLIQLLDLRKQVLNAISLMRPRIQQARKKRGVDVADEDTKADKKATAKIKQRIEEGHDGESDRRGKEATEDQRQREEVQNLTERHHFAHGDALRTIDETIKAGNAVRWIQSRQSSPAFFDVEPLPGVIQVALNSGHPVYEHLYEVMHPDVDDMDEDEIRERLARSAAAFRILLYAWARYEEEQVGTREKKKVRDARFEWGKYAEEFFDEGDEDDDGN